jgi:ribosome-binding protein aMBF1 (putative translation factor)
LALCEIIPYMGVMLTPEQSRAARGWLDWSQETLAKAANVSLSTVRDFEKKRRDPIANNMAAMERALQNAGIEMVLDKRGNPIGIERRHTNGAASVFTPEEPRKDTRTN